MEIENPNLKHEGPETPPQLSLLKRFGLSALNLFFLRPGEFIVTETADKLTQPSEKVEKE